MSVTLRSFMQPFYAVTSGKNSVDIGIVFCYPVRVTDGWVAVQTHCRKIKHRYH